MKTCRFALLLTLATLLSGVTVHAQEQSARTQPGSRPEGERRERGFARRDPLFATLDANTNGVIDAGEISQAPAALRTLDKNGDGKLTQEELRPNPAARERPGQDNASAEAMVDRLMQFDKNGDGRLSKDEVPERMQGLLERGDIDKDGSLSADEIRKLGESRNSAAPGRGRGEEREREERDSD